MYIISKFKDYYDSVGFQFGIDKSIIYKRETKELISYEEIKLFNRYDQRFLPLLAQWFLIGFCGKIYPCLKQVKTIKKGYYSENIVSYHYGDDIIKIIEENHNNKAKYNFRNLDEEIAEIHKMENLDFSDLFFKYKVPVFVASINNDSNPILNPNLKEFEFFKVKDTFTAFQEIQQYISGVLGTDANEPIVTDDKYKILAAGFDIKSSFRKDKKN